MRKDCSDEACKARSGISSCVNKSWLAIEFWSRVAPKVLEIDDDKSSCDKSECNRHNYLF